MTFRPRSRGAARAALAVGLALLAVPASAAAQSPAPPGGTTPTAPTPAAPSTTAQQLAGLTASNQILLFRSDSPGNLQGSATVTGLQSGERLLGLDADPANGRLYALGSSNRIYAIDPVTGEATAISSTPFSPPLNGQSFTFSIDDSTQQARVLSDSGQDLRISVGNGQVAGVDSAYSYQAGDPGAGTAPALSALAYTVPPAGGGTPSLYGIDTGRDVLVSSATNAATVRTIGPLGIDAGTPASLDITASGGAYAALRPGGVPLPLLYTIDLTKGTATPVSSNPALATIAYRTSSTAAADTPVIAMASLGTVPRDQSAPRVSISVSSTQLVSRLLSGGLQFTVNCNEACRATATLSLGGQRLGPVDGSVLATAGLTRMRVRLDHDSRHLIRTKDAVLMRLHVTVTDAAGNQVSTTRSIRTR